MLTDDLDKALTRSTTPKIDVELSRMAREAEGAQRPSFLGRFGRRGATLAIVGGLLAGGGTAAAATSNVWFQGNWSAGQEVQLSNGTACQIAFSVAENPNGTPMTSPAAVEARHYLTSIDLSSMLTPNATSSADCAAQGAELSRTLNGQINAHLKAEGYDTNHLWTVDAAHWNPKR
ncbi:hypothetical protein [Frondihabitans sucicola]|nr:hypothetical protein [Frondihabitans sucicola]